MGDLRQAAFRRTGTSPEYVGRYTHRVAISNNRLVSMDNGRVRFRWKDYRDGNCQKIMTVDANEFIRRFLIHVLPDGSATSASWATAIVRGSSSAAGNCSGWHRPIERSIRRLAIEIAIRRSPGSHCENVRTAKLASWW